MAGGHLERDGQRVWLSAPALLKGSLAEELQGALNPAGHIKLFHRPAAFYWKRRCGCGVHEFAYDWRLSLDDAASRLRAFIDALPGSPGPIRIAAHSMGGCVAARFASLFPDSAAWRRVEQVFLFGVPLGGTFAAVEVLLGQFLLPRLVAGASGFRRRREVLNQLKTVASGMPGLIELFPDPRLFPTASLLYESRHWPPECAPTQELLDRSFALKREFTTSPLLERAQVLATGGWRTPGGVKLDPEGHVALDPAATTPGDVVTPLASATLGGLLEDRRMALRLPHAFLLYEPAGLARVGSPAV